MSEKKRNKAILKAQGAFNRLVEILETKQAKLAEFDSDPKVMRILDKRRTMLEDIEGIIERVKLEARKLVKTGTTRTLHSSAKLQVIVVAGKKPVIYDFDAAASSWTEEVLDAARPRSLDPTVIEELLQQGDLEQSDLDGVKKYGEAPTPRVTVKAL